MTKRQRDKITGNQQETEELYFDNDDLSFVSEDNSANATNELTGKIGEKYYQTKTTSQPYNENFADLTDTFIEESLSKSLVKGCDNKIDERLAQLAANEIAETFIRSYTGEKLNLLKFIANQLGSEIALEEFQKITENFQSLLNTNYIFSESTKINQVLILQTFQQLCKSFKI